MMLDHARLGGQENCSAGSLTGQVDILDIIHKLSLDKSHFEIQNDNCLTLVTMVRILSQKDPSSIIQQIDNAVQQECTMWTAEQGVLSNIDAISVVDVNVGQTLRHVLFSEEFQDRDFEERQHIIVSKGGRLLTVQPVVRRIKDYVLGMVESIHNFSAGLLAIDMPAGSAGLLRVIAKKFYDDEDSCGDPVVPIITQGDTSTPPVVSVEITDGHGICEISLYNLGDQDLFFSENPIRKSAQLHKGNFLIRGRTDGEVPKHNCNTVPARGFAYLAIIQTDGEENDPEIQLKDVNGKVVVAFTLQFRQ
jgi:hypothetical protein